MNTSYFFKHENVGDRIEPGSAPLFGDQHAAAAESTQFLDGLERKVVRALPIFDVRANFRLHELPDGVAEEDLVVRKGEVHWAREF